MQRFFLNKYLISLLLISILQAYTSRCCIEQERIALLELKANFMSLSLSDQTSMEYVSGELSSWGDGDNCCIWQRVKCNGSMEHVSELSLDQIFQSQLISNYVINVSLFEPFGELISLNLSDNSISGLVGIKGEKKLTLKNLEILDFGNNSMEKYGEIEDLVGSLPLLKKLILRDNGLEESFPTRVLVNLKHLQVLDLSGTNQMDGLLPALANLKELIVLDLSFNELAESLSEKGGLCELQNLQELYLRMTYITGPLPRCFGNLTSLRILDLSFNNLSGDLFPIIPNHKSLESLSISDNSFSGEFSLNSLLNHSNLGVLILSNNNLHVQIDDSRIHSKSNFQPQILGLSNCNLNTESRSFLKFLSQMHNLQILDISHNGLVGSFPTWLLHNNANIKAIMLRNNSFKGVFSLPNHRNQSFLVLDLSENHFNGTFPENIGTIFPRLQFLNSSKNDFEGKIPTSLGNMTRLEVLELSNNNFSGELPRSIYTHCRSLRYLRLSNNNLQGEIIPGYMNLTQLFVLHLDGNHFTGTIEDRLLKSNSSLVLMDISNNEVSGGIPSWIGNFSSLTSLSISNNQLKGQIPRELCNLYELVYLDLSNNGLTGVIPSCYNQSQLMGLQLRDNLLSGTIPNTIPSNSQLVTLDLSGNQLSGGIPSWIGNLSQLNILLLAHNSLQGELPESLCEIPQLNIMDLSNNGISGGILTCLANMTFGTFPSPNEIETYNEGDTFVSFGISSKWYFPGGTIDGSLNEEVVTLLTKSKYNDYKGYILDIMSVLDLSCNSLTGEIPKELGQLDKLNALNLSHNEFSGSIPSSFSSLKSIESLDLSYNNLSGGISSGLAQVTSLEIFNVSYNNLSGVVPQTGQFASFDESNYKGNPFLCGFVGKDCKTASKDISSDQEDDGSTTGFDWEVFFWSFGVSSTTLFLAFIVVLLINPQWRRAWFLFIDYHFLWWL